MQVRKQAAVQIFTALLLNRVVVNPLTPSAEAVDSLRHRARNGVNTRRVDARDDIYESIEIADKPLLGAWHIFAKSALFPLRPSLHCSRS